MSAASEAAARAAREAIRSKEADGRGVEELDDEMDPQAEERLQDRLVELGKVRSIGAPRHAPSGTAGGGP